MNMMHNDDAFATMLLMSQITPSREELVRPLSVSEWHALNQRLHDAGMRGMGALLNLDMSGFTLRLDIAESEAYRLCVLLSRVLPLTMSLERFALNGIRVITYSERSYPARLRDRLGVQAPPMLYLSGTPALFRQDAIAILGAHNARGDAERIVRKLSALAIDAGYAVITDGTTGVARIAEDEAVFSNGRVLEIAAEALLSRVEQPDMLSMIELGTGSVMSLEHPEAPYTASHALRRNKCLYAFAQAVFVVSAEHKKGATFDGACEAMNKKYCDFVYVWDTDLYPGNRPLIERGATPISVVTPETFDPMVRAWHRATAKQLSFFDR